MSRFEMIKNKVEGMDIEPDLKADIIANIELFFSFQTFMMTKIEADESAIEMMFTFHMQEYLASKMPADEGDPMPDEDVIYGHMRDGLIEYAAKYEYPDAEVLGDSYVELIKQTKVIFDTSNIEEKEEMVKTLILTRGVPGSGKTTVAELLAGGNYPVYSADDYFYKDGVYKFNPTKLGSAHGQCKIKTEAALKKGVDIIFVANTFTTNKEINPYKKLAEKYDYRLVSLIVENRHGNDSVHGVPTEKREEMAQKIIDSIKLV